MALAEINRKEMACTYTCMTVMRRMIYRGIGSAVYATTRGEGI
jgi:hypothetical protein